MKTDKEFLESMARSDEVVDHDGETCGLCHQMRLGAEVAREMLAADDTGKGAILRWSKTTQNRWKDSKFFKLWQEEKAAGRNPEDAFKARGWEA